MRERRRTWLILLALLPLHWWLAHAAAFFPHEYAHAFVAWALGWKANPLDLHFPPLTPTVALIQLGVTQNVDEAPIFAAGYGTDAGLIALAGALVGNALVSLPLSRLLWGAAMRHGRRWWGLLAFWWTTASIGNLWDYVPIRSFTLESDMGSVRRGFGWSAYELLAILGIPTALVLAWYLARVVPRTLAWLFPDSAAQRITVAALAMFALFGFYGAAGLDDGGPVSHRLALVSILALFPLAALAEGWVVARIAAPRHGRVA